jgi:cell division protein FtsB
MKKNKLFNNIPEPYRKVLKNKYFITAFSFLLWLSFFDRNDFITQHAYRTKLHELQKERDYYIREIALNKTEVSDQLTNPKNLEKYAREKHRMKKDNEDVYVMVQEEPKKK